MGFFVIPEGEIGSLALAAPVLNIFTDKSCVFDFNPLQSAVL
jgi:hypothetical protein